MKKLRKIISVILIFSIMITVFPVTNVKASTLGELQAKYPTGSIWTGGGECDGFAHKMYEEFYGISASLYGVTSTNIYDIQPGDLVRYKYPGGKHSVWVTGRNGDTVTVGEANYDEKNGIRWGQVKYISEFSSIEYIAKAPYRLDQNPPAIGAPKNIQAKIQNKKVYVTWDAIEHTSGYIIKAYRKADVEKGDFTKAVATQEIKNAVNGNYNYGYIDIKESGDFYIFVHTKLGYLVSSNGGTPSLINVKTIESITLKVERTELMVGEGCYINYSYLPEDANVANVRIWLSDSSLATFNPNNNYLSAKKTGTLKIYAEGSNGVQSFVTIKIIDGIPVKRIDLDAYSKTVRVGGTAQIKVTKFYPENATIKTVEYENNNPELFSIDENGVITGLKEGKGTVMVKSGSAGMTVSVTVIPGIKASSITFDKTSIEMYEKETSQITATVYPTNAYNKTLNWTSSNENVAKVEDRIGYSNWSRNSNYNCKYNRW